MAREKFAVRIARENIARAWKEGLGWQVAVRRGRNSIDAKAAEAASSHAANHARRRSG
jgi:hypothetical protein